MPVQVPDDDHKTRARRRLIGAVALTLVAVIILPLVLKDQPPPAGSLEVHMPPGMQKQHSAGLPDNITFAPPPEYARINADEPAKEATSEPAAKSDPAEPNTKGQKLEVKKAEPAARQPAQEPAKTAVPDKATANSAQSYTVQVGVFSDKSNVQKLQARITALNLKSYTDELGKSTRVRVGSYSSREQAEKTVVRLKDAGMAAQVVEK